VSAISSQKIDGTGMMDRLQWDAYPLSHTVSWYIYGCIQNPFWSPLDNACNNEHNTHHNC